jgi:hypothetical protein
VDILVFLSKKRPINFGKEEKVCPRVYCTMVSVFEAIAIVDHIFKREILFLTLRKIRFLFVVRAAKEDVSSSEAASYDGFTQYLSVKRWCTLP